MTREEMWEEFESQLIRETRTPLTMSFDDAEKLTKLGIEETVAKWKKRLEQTALLEQVRWERDVAISQLHELGYEFGETIEQQPCTDAISRQAVEAITWEEPSYTDALNALTEVREKIRTLPSVSTEKTGHWIHIFMENGADYFEAWDIAGVHTFAAQYRCDKCGFVHTVIEDFGRYLYCPNCGAKMEVEE